MSLTGCLLIYKKQISQEEHLGLRARIEERGGEINCFTDSGFGMVGRFPKKLIAELESKEGFLIYTTEHGALSQKTIDQLKKEYGKPAAILADAYNLFIIGETNGNT